MVGTLSAIHIYPVKSCRATALARVDVAKTGLSGDRLFQVIDADDNPVTQRKRPMLAHVQPTITSDGLRIECDGRQAIHVTAPTVNDTTAKSMFDVPVDAGDAGDEAAAWFTDLLEMPVRLVAMTTLTDYRLPVSGIDMSLSWADGAAVLVANSASLQWLNERAGEPFGMDRFRPNLTVDTHDAWVEDTWRDFSIGTARFELGIAWPRCAIPQIDQVDGSRHKEPARVLKDHRWCSDASSAGEGMRPLIEGNALFGIGCSSSKTVGSTVAVGDEITVRETGGRIIAAPV